jgi:uncharacterized membrane protein YcfT
VTKLTRAVPAPVIWGIGAALEIAHIHTGSVIIDEFASRFVYFYSGYVLAPHIFSFAAWVQGRAAAAVAGLVLWGVVNGVLVAAGYAGLPFVSLALGAAGAAAVVAVSSLMANVDLFRPLRYCGEHSIVVYLAFFLPMAATRTVLIKAGLITDVGTISALVTLAGVVGALVLFWAVRGTVLRFLFERPERFWLTPKRRVALQAAE